MLKKALRKNDTAFTKDHKAFRVEEYRELLGSSGLVVSDVQTVDAIASAAARDGARLPQARAAARHPRCRSRGAPPAKVDRAIGTTAPARGSCLAPPPRARRPSRPRRPARSRRRTAWARANWSSFYDAGCGVCTHVMRALARRDRRRPPHLDLEPGSPEVPARRAAGASRPDDPRRRPGDGASLDARRGVLRGARGAPRLAVGRVGARRARASRRLAGWFYDWFSRNRGDISAEAGAGRVRRSRDVDLRLHSTRKGPAAP